MAAEDSQKKRTDDPIARAVEQRDEQIRTRRTGGSVIGSAMDQIDDRSKRIEPYVEMPAVEEEPTFFSRSRDERAAQARRAAQRVRRREPDPERNEFEPLDVEAPAELPKYFAPTHSDDESEIEGPAETEHTPDPAPRAGAPVASDPVASETAATVGARVAKDAKIDASDESAPPEATEPKPTPSPEEERKRTAVQSNLQRLRDLDSQRAVAKTPEEESSDAAAPDSEKPAPASVSPKQDAAAPNPSAPKQSVEPAKAADNTARTEKSALKPDPLEELLKPAPRHLPETPEKAPNAAIKESVTPESAPSLIERAESKADASIEPSAPKPDSRNDRSKPLPASAASPDAAMASARVVSQPLESPMAADVQPLDGIVPPSAPLQPARTKAFAPFEWMIASRYLRARKKEGFVSVIAGFSLVGIALGVATLIIVMAVMTGFRETLIEQIVGVNAHLNVTSQSEKFEDYDPLAKAIRDVDGVTSVTPLVQGQVLANSDRGHSGVVVRGMKLEDLNNLKVVTAPEVSQGSLDEFQGDNGVAIGTRLAAKLGLRVGDFITLISPDGDITPFSATPMPRKKDYRVLYTFQLGLYEYDSAFVYMPLEEAQIYFNKKGEIDSLEVMVDSPNNPEAYVGPIRKAARRSIGVYTWKDLNGGLISALDIERKVMFVILTMIILVAALNIISGLVMLVKDKTRDIAIMRTMGIARGSILRIFFICGASIGVIGSIVGVILGVAFSWNIGAIQRVLENLTGTSFWDPQVRMLSEVPAKLVFSDVALTLFIALALSFLATLYPAWKAAKLDPVEALRYE